MPTVISLKRAVQSAIIFIMFVAVLMVWPFKLICSWEQEEELSKDTFLTLHYEEKVLEEVVPQQIGLTYVKLALGNEQFAADDKLKLEVYNENMELLESREILLKKFSGSGICEIKLSSKLAEGTQYYFSVQNLGRPLELSSEDGEHLSPAYVYKVDFSKMQYLVRALLILAVGGLLLLMTEQFLGKNTRKVRFDYGIRLAAALLLSGFCLWLAYCVFPGQKFSTDIVDIVFYEAGIFLFLAYMLYGLLHKREDMKQERLAIREIEAKVPELLQVIAFAGVMEGCVRRANAPTNHYLSLATTFLYGWFAIAILCSFAKKELVNWYNIVYCIVAAGVGIWYCRQYRDYYPLWEQAEGRTKMLFFWGFVLLNTLLLLVKNRRQTKVNKSFLASALVLLAGMILFRNGKTWVFEITIFWGMFALQVVYRGNRKLWIKRFSEGILLHFIYASVNCILYRPYQHNASPGYRMAFHTTTVTGVYLILVLVVAFARFLEKYKQTGSLKKLWKELGIIGMSAAFLFMSLCRTGMLTAIVVIPITLIVTLIVEFKDGVRGIFKRTGIFLGAAVVFLPIAFTAVRTVPAVEGKPIVHEVEKWVYEPPINVGEEWDSEKFITVKEFLEDVDRRLFHKTKGDDRDYADALASGRITIWKAYLRELNWTGHKEMSVELDNGKTIVHAHNTFIQSAYDFGIGVGVYFLLFCILTGVMAIRYYIQHKEEETRLVPVLLIAAFGFCSLTEWTFYPTLPIGLAFLTMITLLLVKEEKHETNG